MDVEYSRIHRMSLSEYIVNHCVPVIISDNLIKLPFEDDLDYSEFSLFFSVDNAEPGRLLRMLRSVTKERWLKLWTRLKTVSHHFKYQHPSKKDDAVNMIFKQVQHKVPAPRPALKRAFHRLNRQPEDMKAKMRGTRE